MHVTFIDQFTLITTLSLQLKVCVWEEGVGVKWDERSCFISKSEVALSTFSDRMKPKCKTVYSKLKLQFSKYKFDAGVLKTAFFFSE